MTAQNQSEQQDTKASEVASFDAFDGLWDGSIETKEDFLNRSRGTYSVSFEGPSGNLLFERFLDAEHASYPDIDLNFVDGDRVRDQVKESLKEKYSSSPSAFELPE